MSKTNYFGRSRKQWKEIFDDLQYLDVIRTFSNDDDFVVVWHEKEYWRIRSFNSIPIANNTHKILVITKSEFTSIFMENESVNEHLLDELL